MDESFKVLGRQFLEVEFGGDSHEGWLPEGAALPPPTPRIAVSLRLTIYAGSGGFILEWKGLIGEYSGDTWHDTKEGALASARERFGADPADWNLS